MKKQQAFTFDEEDLKKELMREAKVLGIAMGAAEIMADKIAKKVAHRIAKRAMITMNDFNRFVAEAAEKYDVDLAYIYKNRDKII